MEGDLTEWLTCLTRNQVGCARTGSSPVVVIFYSCSTIKYYIGRIKYGLLQFSIDGEHGITGIPPGLALYKL